MKRLSIFVLLIFGILELTAQDVSFTAKAKTVVREGQKFYLQYESNQKINNLNLPDLGKFTAIRGQSQSSGTNIRIINGKREISHTYKYSYLLRAPEAGTYTIPPATATIKGKNHSSNKLSINVVEGNNGGSNQQRNQSNNNTTTQTSGSGSEAFVRLNVNKTNVYEGEPIYARLKLYVPKRNIAGFKDISFPQFNGFWSEDFKKPDQIKLSRETYNNKAYWVAELSSWILYPQRAGNLKIKSGTYDVVFREAVSGSSGGGVFGSFFTQYKNVPKTLKNNPVTINVKSLPGGQPANFTGGVGDFSISTDLSHDSIDVNEAFNISIKVSGRGNLNLLNEPEIKLPEVFEVYDPEISSNFSQTTGGAKGSIIYDYTIIPRYPDDYTIDPVNISWFDTKSNTYKTFESEKFKIHVIRTEDFEKGQPQVKGKTRGDVNMISEDIRFIRDIDLNKNNRHSFYNTFKFWLFYIIPFIVLGIISFLRRKQIKERANVAKLRNKKANKTAKGRLKKSRKLMEDKSQEFYNEVIKALWGYVADKLDMSTAELSRDNVNDKLSEKDISEELKSELIEIIDKCEYAHFAPDKTDIESQKIYQEAADLITKLEHKL